MDKAWYGPFSIFTNKILMSHSLLNLISQFQLSIGHFSVVCDYGSWPHTILITAIYRSIIAQNIIMCIDMGPVAGQYLQR